MRHKAPGRFYFFNFSLSLSLFFFNNARIIHAYYTMNLAETSESTSARHGRTHKLATGVAVNALLIEQTLTRACTYVRDFRRTIIEFERLRSDFAYCFIKKEKKGKRKFRPLDVYEILITRWREDCSVRKRKEKKNIDVRRT